MTVHAELGPLRLCLDFFPLHPTSSVFRTLQPSTEPLRDTSFPLPRLENLHLRQPMNNAEKAGKRQVLIQARLHRRVRGGR
ncbi:hypothetical protein HYQ46_004634 [Verticillium longisporum]|nr:hypothetical protein HYQ46_004634 [Verticillium longisporum]